VDTDSIARAWRTECVSGGLWLPAENQAGAADAIADGFYMVSECIGWRRAYVKPRAPGGVKGRPAREKIAFDLAFDVGVPVAPVVLIDRHDAGMTEERFVDASLVMFPGQQPWWAVRRALNKPGASPLRDKARQSLSIDAARALAFDTWVGQTEHQPDHPHNIILGWEQSRSSFVFLDYEYAFGGLDDEWRGDRRFECAVAPFPEELLDALDPACLEGTISRIEGVSPSTIEAIVTRIPSEFLDDGPKSVIIEGLVARQALVRDVLRGKVNE
jgi:hypothetical protein